MTIYILSNNNNKTAQYLDDEALDLMIRDIAYVILLYSKELEFEESRLNKELYGWYQWIKDKKANYECLVNLGYKCANEWSTRFELITNSYYYMRPYHSSMEYIYSKWVYINDWSKYFNPEVPLFVPSQYRFTENYNEILSSDKMNILSYRKYYIQNIMKNVNKCPCGGMKKTLECSNIHTQWTKRHIPIFVLEREPIASPI